MCAKTSGLCTLRSRHAAAPRQERSTLLFGLCPAQDRIAALIAMLLNRENQTQTRAQIHDMPCPCHATAFVAEPTLAGLAWSPDRPAPSGIF